MRKGISYSPNVGLMSKCAADAAALMWLICAHMPRVLELHVLMLRLSFVLVQLWWQR